MAAACPALVGEGVIHGVLATADCQTRHFAQAGYLALTGESSPFQAALTALLTIYVAVVGYRLLFASGNARLSDGVGIALKIGVVLALVTSWANFQTLVFDVASRAPKEMAAIAAGPLSDGSSLTASPVDGLQTAYDQLTLAAVAFGRGAPADAKAFANPQVAGAEALSGAAGALFASSAGLIAAATLAVGVLTAIGPVFIALFLTPATRGLFVGWLRALVAVALIPMGAWILNLMMLAALEPWLVALAEQRRTLSLDPQTALSAAAVVFVFAAAQAAMVAAFAVIAFSFRFKPRTQVSSEQPANASVRVDQAGSEAMSRTQLLAQRLRTDAQASVDVRARPEATAAAMAAPRTIAGEAPRAPTRIGDGYRRPAPGMQRRPAQ